MAENGGSVGVGSLSQKRLVVLGSVNLDIVAHAPHLPRPGETVSGAALSRYPGGKGANQALAAKRLGADVSLCARTGQDADADAALALLKADGVDLSQCLALPNAQTGVALIIVDEKGENQITVASGANHSFQADPLHLPPHDALLCQLEVPIAVIRQASTKASGLFCLNAAPVKPVPPDILSRTDLLIVNESEAEALEENLRDYHGILAITLGARGAILMQDGTILARAAPPSVEAIDTVGAGDAFCAALVIAFLEGKGYQEAVEFACRVGAFATTRKGAQPAMPYRADLDSLFNLQ
ncbi:MULTISPECIES: ribokinase [unclassified Iodidimonas]|uniref:ribokinase n=1 Tax=unclassified Iodidimonas TaxID=2626145 RepID=UPI0024826FE3|nr:MULTISPECIES: ribokinase [unclassified Iodidimonas]